MARDAEVTVVTGAAGALGRAVAAALPGRVVGVDLAAADGVTALNCADEKAAREFFAGLRDRGDRVRGLVNVAGKPGERALADLDCAFWDDVWRANVTSAMLMTRFAAPLMARGSAVVNFASVAAFRGFAERAAYCASKAAVAGLTRALAVELAPRGVRVNAIAPGAIDSPWIERLIDNADDAAARAAFARRAPLNRLGRPEEIGMLARFLLSAEAGFITGAVLPADGGALAF